MRKDKSVYSTPHCLGYMVKTAWKHQRDVLWRLMLAVACAVGLQAMQLYAAPEILASVERQDSISDLLRVILMFSLGMLLVSTVKTYFAYSAQLRRIAVRSVLIDRVIEKACTMSYCLCSDSKAIAVKNGAYMAVGDNNSGTEHIWVTLETLLSGVGCFAVYLTLLTDLNPVLAVAVIAMALCCNPCLLLADEPTTALDVTIQKQILNLFLELQESDRMSIMMVTHDIGVAAQVADQIAIMYGGIILECGATRQVLETPANPYTKALISAIPLPKYNAPDNQIILKGEITSPINVTKYCRFAPRCVYAKPECFENEPQLEEIEKDHFVKCHFVREINGL